MKGTLQMDKEKEAAGATNDGQYTNRQEPHASESRTNNDEGNQATRGPDFFGSTEGEAFSQSLRKTRQALALSEQFGWLYDFCLKIIDDDIVRIGEDNEPILPIRDLGAQEIGQHCRFAANDGHGWMVKPTGTPLLPFIFGRPLAEANEVHIFAEYWGPLTLYALYQNQQIETAITVIATRGFHAKNLAHLPIQDGPAIYLWPQNNDDGEGWSKRVIRYLGKNHPLSIVRIPRDFRGFMSGSKQE